MKDTTLMEVHVAQLAYNNPAFRQENQSEGAAISTDSQNKPANKLLSRKRKKSRHPLRDLRLGRGYTLEELADLTELSPSYLSRLESGSRRLNADILTRLSDVLACHPGDLLPTDGAPNRFGTISGRHPLEANENPDPFVAGRYPSQDLPLYQINGQNGALYITHPETPSEWVSRPCELLGVTGALSFSIQGDNLGVSYQSGDRLFAHPTKPLTPNCRILAVTDDYKIYAGEFTGWRSALNDFTTPADRLSFRTISRDESGDIRQENHLLESHKIKAVYRLIGSVEAA